MKNNGKIAYFRDGTCINLNAAINKNKIIKKNSIYR